MPYRRVVPLLIFLAACTSTRNAVTFPIETHAGHVYVRASVNGSEPLWFLLDTGAAAPVNLIDAKRATALRLEEKEHKTAGAIGGSTNVTLTAPVKLTLGAYDLGEQPLAKIDLGDTEDEGLRVDGILGYAFFRDHVVTIDYRRKLLILDEPSKRGTVIPLTFDGKTPIVNARISIGMLSKEPVRLVMDTGFDNPLLLNAPFVNQHGLVGDAIQNGVGLGGTTGSGAATASEFLLGDLNFGETQVRLATDTSGAFSSEDVDGFLGSTLLQKFVVTIDYRSGRMILGGNR